MLHGRASTRAPANKDSTIMAASVRATTEPLSAKNTKYRQLTLGAPQASSVKEKKQILKETKGILFVVFLKCVHGVSYDGYFIQPIVLIVETIG